MFYLIPIMITTSLYPTLINAKAENNDRMKIIYYRSFVPLCIYGFLSFTFIYSYSDIIIPLLFGSKYLSTSAYCKEMFLVMLIFPTIFLQANVLLTLRLEKLDMICNIVCLILNIAISIIGLKYFKSLSVVNYAIFISFIVFHIIQDYILIKNKITDISHVVSFYLSSLTVILSYILLSKIISKEILFVFFWMILSIIYFIINKRKSILNFQVQNQ
jgi:O-antigen/teichoic acid export membrane protein